MIVWEMSGAMLLTIALLGLIGQNHAQGKKSFQSRNPIVLVYFSYTVRDFNRLPGLLSTQRTPTATRKVVEVKLSHNAHAKMMMSAH
jgi:hypothetical protein